MAILRIGGIGTPFQSPAQNTPPAVSTNNMKKQTILILIIFILSSCIQNTPEDSEWEKVSKSKDFIQFFNYSINCSDNEKLIKCIDSLEKYKPLENNTYIVFANSCVENNEVNYEEKFLLNYQENDNSLNLRNVYSIYINEDNKIWAEYLNNKHDDYKTQLINIYESTISSFDLPEFYEIKINDSVVLVRKIGVIIYTQIINKNKEKSTSWLSLINVTKEILKIFMTIRDNRAIETYGIPYNNIEDIEKAKIDLMVMRYIEIHFSFIPEAPAPNKF